MIVNSRSIFLLIDDISSGYMAPEYVHDGKISAQADIYSLGLMIIEITTGVKKSRAIGQPSARKYIDEVRRNIILAI